MSRPASADDGGAVPPPRNDVPAGESTRPPSTDDESPGVPGFRTWRGVYWFVLVWFIGCVLGLTWLTHLT